MIHEVIHACEDVNEDDCDPNKNIRTYYTVQIVSTLQSPAQAAAQQAEYDTINNGYTACNALVAATAVGVAWYYGWTSLVAAASFGVIGAVGGVTCLVVYTQQMSAHNAKVANCEFVSPHFSIPIPVTGPSCW